MEKKLRWKESPKEKRLLKQRYDVIQDGLDRSLFRSCDLKLFYNAKRINENEEYIVLLDQLQNGTITITEDGSLTNFHSNLSLKRLWFYQIAQ